MTRFFNFKGLLICVLLTSLAVGATAQTVKEQTPPEVGWIDIKALDVQRALARGAVETYTIVIE